MIVKEDSTISTLFFFMKYVFSQNVVLKVNMLSFSCLSYSSHTWHSYECWSYSWSGPSIVFSHLYLIKYQDYFVEKTKNDNLITILLVTSNIIYILKDSFYLYLFLFTEMISVPWTKFRICPYLKRKTFK